MTSIETLLTPAVNCVMANMPAANCVMAKMPTLPRRASVIWSIAGSDNSAGAGIQADLKTAQSFSSPTQPLHLCTIITAVTAQHSAGVDGCVAMSPSLLRQQAAALLQEQTPVAIKIGLLVNAAQVQWLSELLAQLRAQSPELLVVYDPVAISSSGTNMAEPDLYQAVSQYLLPVLDIITPNLPEFVALTQCEALAQGAQVLFARGVKALIVKGGHGRDVAHCNDQLFVSADFRYRGYPAYCDNVLLQSDRQPHRFNHGTGCSFSSALTAALALGYPLEDAFVLAKSYVNQGLAQPVVVNQHAGTLAHNGFVRDPQYLPKLLSSVINKPTAAFLPLTAPLGLYVIVSSVTELLRALAAGVTSIQLRIKSRDQHYLQVQIQQAIQYCRLKEVQLFINDHWQLAITYGAYGVHLGQEDLETADLMALQKAGIRLGISNHGFYKLLRAQQLQPSYLAIGAVFSTQTKDMAGKIQGLDKLRHYVELFNSTPLVAIGGINEHNAAAVLATGIKHLAVAQAFASAPQPEQWVSQMRALWHPANKEVENAE